jgi:formate dehydrogenase iron-sulfur subunit
MSFGDREQILERAEKRLAEVQVHHKEAMLANAGDVRAIYLLADDPERYHKFAVAENMIGITRKVALKRLFRHLNPLAQRIG